MSKILSSIEGQKGSALLVTLLLVALVGAGGYYAYSKGSLNMRVSKTSPAPNPTINYTPEPGVVVEKDMVSEADMTLTIDSPASGLELTSGNVKVSGKTKANAEVFVNDVSTRADANGNFSVNISLDEGVNEIVVSANDEVGNAVEKTISVNVQTF